MERVADIMRHSGVVFGTSGARGLVEDMTGAVCRAYTQAFLEVVGRKFGFSRVAVGVDLRPSSPGIAAACGQAVAGLGYAVDFCGPLPTPALALYGLEESIPVVMVTGSHIPFDRNGIKFYRPDCEISKADEQAMADTMVELSQDATPFSLAEPNPAPLQRYIKRFLDFFPPGLLAGMRLGLYEHSSVARKAFREVLQGLVAEVTALGRTDHFVPIDTEAVAAQDVERGRTWSREHGFDAILSFDGDGDRPLIADETGAWLRGDIVGLLCARYLGADTVVCPVSCNTAIEKSSLFDTVIRTKIGSPYVIAGMEQAQADGRAKVVGFEANGGFLVGSAFERAGKELAPLPTRDAMLPSITALATARERGCRLSEILYDLPGRYTASDRITGVPSRKSLQLIEELTEDGAKLQHILSPAGTHPAHIDTTDGLRVTFANEEIIHLRPSGNAPELRCYSEAGDRHRAKILTSDTLARVAKILDTSS